MTVMINQQDGPEAAPPTAPLRLDKSSPRQRSSLFSDSDKQNLPVDDAPKLCTKLPALKLDRSMHNCTPYSRRGLWAYYISQIVANLHDNASAPCCHIATCVSQLRLLSTARIPSEAELRTRRVNLPARSDCKKTLVLDLDETLIHCNQNLQSPHDHKIQVEFPDGSRTQMGINVRPYARQFIRKMSRLFQLVVFTASQYCYAQKVLELIDPGRLVGYCLHRDNCWLTDTGYFVKDLRVIGGRSMSDIVLVDNAGYSFAFNLDNAVPILNYYSGPDYELQALESYLLTLVFKDVRTTNRQTFKLEELAMGRKPLKELVRRAYGDWIFLQK